MAPDRHETATLDAFDEITRRELSREAVTMVLYVSISCWRPWWRSPATTSPAPCTPPP